MSVIGHPPGLNLKFSHGSPDISWNDNKILHSNYAYVVYDDLILGRLENVRFIVEKDIEYDVIIGSGGKPFGQPILKKTKFYGSFSKGMFKVSEVDKAIMLDSVGNAHADYQTSHDNFNFSSANLTKFIDDDSKSFTLFPSAFPSLAIAFGGVVIKKTEIDISNNKFIKFSGEFIGKFIEYLNELTIGQYQEATK